MRIRMAGIDFNTADVEERERFSFTSLQIKNALTVMRRAQGIKGCVLLSTCNRTELWVSEKDSCDSDPLALLCAAKGLDTSPRLFEHLFTRRDGGAAVMHLFETTCGLRSQVLGEDQILAQVKDAAFLAREVSASDDILEKLFQAAVTSAKRIKTQIRITAADASVAHGAIQMAKEFFGGLGQKKCLVIGNGEMGRLTAALLMKEGATVTITLRQHKQGKNAVPDGCASINYDNRCDLVPENDIIVSATISPHLTLRREDVRAIADMDKQFYFMDLALPRDIDEEIGDIPNATLIGIDQIGMDQAVDQNALGAARQVIAKSMGDFYKWYISKKYLNLLRHPGGLSQDTLFAGLRQDIDGLPDFLWQSAASEKSGFEQDVRKALMKAV